MTPTAGASVHRRPPRISIVATVLGALGTRRHHRMASALAVTAALHGALWLWAGGSIDRSAASHPPARDIDVELAPPIAPPPQATLEPTPSTPVKTALIPPVTRIVAPSAARSASSSEPASSEPARPASAVITREAAGPVDLTGDTIVTGTAAAYAGGATTSMRTDTSSLPAAALRATGSAGAPLPLADHHSAVSLEGRNWSCPWPREADAEQIDQEVVVLRVVVDPDGSTQSVEVVTDPGHGFGPAAIACALGTLFTPARDRTGTPIRARSPPIRVTFVR